MRMFDVQAIEIAAPCRLVFAFISEPDNLPQWAHASQDGLDPNREDRTKIMTIW
jgi:uncharacterized protein YndB with AHSA1/START domain